MKQLLSRLDSQVRTNELGAAQEKSFQLKDQAKPVGGNFGGIYDSIRVPITYLQLLVVLFGCAMGIRLAKCAFAALRKQTVTGK